MQDRTDIQKPVYLSEVKRIKVHGITHIIPSVIPPGMNNGNSPYIGQPYRPFVLYGCCVFLDEKGAGHWEDSKNCTYLYS